MWQRGLSLFYAERQEEAMEQFEVDVVQDGVGILLLF